MENTLLIASEVARLLRVEKQRIYELCRQHKIPFVLLGERQYRFSKEAVCRSLGIKEEELSMPNATDR